MEDREIQWVAESRHLTQDFQRYFDNPNPRVIALALMSDSDNAGGEAKAWYSDLILSATADHSGCPTNDPDNLGQKDAPLLITTPD